MLKKMVYYMKYMSSTWQLVTKNVEQTQQFGEHIGARLRGGEVIELASDLGGGKTTLTMGIARGAGSEDVVSSPTFTISNVYTGRSVEIHHYDFYRLGELGLMGDEIEEAMADPRVVSVIEWAGTAHDLIAPEKLIRIEIGLVADNENARTLSITAGADVADIVNDAAGVVA